MTPDPLIGTELAGYRLVSPIGRGGMGVVYRAEKGPDDVVAIKVIAPELARSSEFRERFLREGDSALDHPHIVPILGLGDEDSHLFLKMLLVEGTDLKRLIANEGPLRTTRVASLLTQAAEALDFAHAHALVHRDIKSQNLLIEAPGERDHLYLTDFGLVKRVSSESSFTSSGHIVGSAPYMSPEQIRGKGVDGRSDVYALGCVLYECLTGTPPYRRDEEVSVLWAHVNEAVPKPSDEVGTLGDGIDAIVAKAMAKDPDERYLTAGDLAAAVSQDLGVSGIKSRSPWLANRITPSMARPRRSPASLDVAPPSPLPIRGIATAVAALLLTGFVVTTAARSPVLPASLGADSSTLPGEKPVAGSAGNERTTRSARGRARLTGEMPRLGGENEPAPTLEQGVELPLASDLDSPALQAVVPEGSALARSLILFASNSRYTATERQYHGSMDLFAMTADGSDVRNLSPNNPAKTEASVALSPCQQIAFTRYSGSATQLIIADAFGTLIFTTPWSGSSVDWSPRCDSIVYKQDSALRVMAADGSDRRLLFHHQGDPFTPSWSPDGTKIVFDLVTDGDSRDGDIHVVNSDGSGLIRLTSTPDWDSDPVWSPDGEKIAFRRGVLGAGQTDVWVMNADGTEQQRLTESVAIDRPIGWSPDGRHIVFFSGRDSPQWTGPDLRGDIYIMEADGSNERDLIPDSGGEEGWFAWQPSVYRTISTRVNGGKLSGHVRALHNPCERNQSVHIEREVGDGWQLLGSTKTTEDGRFSTPLPESGKYRARLTLTSARGGLLCGLSTSQPREAI